MFVCLSVLPITEGNEGEVLHRNPVGKSGVLRWVPACRRLVPAFQSQWPGAASRILFFARIEADSCSKGSASEDFPCERRASARLSSDSATSGSSEGRSFFLVTRASRSNG